MIAVLNTASALPEPNGCAPPLNAQDVASSPDKAITRQQRKRHGRRAAIEPVISHLKFDYGLIRNFLKGTQGDSMNLLLSAAAFNFKRVMTLWRTEALFRWKLIYNLLINIYREFFALNAKMSF